MLAIGSASSALRGPHAARLTPCRYLSALESHPPLIKRQDYDGDVFDPIDQTLSSGIDTPSGTPLPGLRAFVDLVTTIGSVLEQLHRGYYGASATWARADGSQGGSAAEDAICGLVLRLEAEMDALRERLGEQTFLINLEEQEASGAAAQEPQDALKRTAVAGSLLRQMHFNWYASTANVAVRAQSYAPQTLQGAVAWSRVELT